MRRSIIIALTITVGLFLALSVSALPPGLGGGGITPSPWSSPLPVVWPFASTGYLGGYVQTKGGIAVNALGTPVGCAVVNTGGGTGTTWAYRVSALSSTGETLACSAVSVSKGATLDSTHYNTVTWTAVSGARGYYVYRTTAGGTPNTTGRLGTGGGCTPTVYTGTSAVDNGLCGDTGSVLTTATDSDITGVTGITFPTKTANYVFAGPTTGAAAVPDFRAVVDADVPDTITASNYCKLSGGADCTMAGTAVLANSTEALTSGNYTLNIEGAVAATGGADTAVRIAATADLSGSDKVLSVQDNNTTELFSIAGDGVCTFTAVPTLPVQTANYVFAGPTTGAAAAPTFRAIVDADVPDTIVASNYLPLAGGTMLGNLLFTDNTLDIGASGATRPRTGYFGTDVNVGGDVNVTDDLTCNQATMTYDAIGATLGTTPANTINGVLITNTTAAVAGPGVTVQVPPVLTLHGSAWETTGPSNDTWDWRFSILPATGATSASNLQIHASKDGAAYGTALAYMTHGGELHTNASIYAGSEVYAVSGGGGYTMLSYHGASKIDAVTVNGLSAYNGYAVGIKGTDANKRIFESDSLTYGGGRVKNYVVVQATSAAATTVFTSPALLTNSIMNVTADCSMVVAADITKNGTYLLKAGFSRDAANNTAIIATQTILHEKEAAGIAANFSINIVADDANEKALVTCTNTAWASAADNTNCKCLVEHFSTALSP